MTAEIWHQRTVVTNHDVASDWRDHYDLAATRQRNWKTLGPKLVGKLHVSVGTADNFFLDHAVHLMQESMGANSNPNYVASLSNGSLI